MLGLITGMRLMTGTTRTAAGILVDMEEVQVLTAVAKCRQVRGLIRQRNRFRVAAKAEIVFFHGKRCIELRRIFLDQKPEMIAPMGLVASAAVFISDRTMHELLAFQLLKCGQHFLLVNPLGVLVTGHTQGLGGMLQEIPDR